MKISLAMIIKNEESKIERCISSVTGLVDEIVIVDTGSTDKTIDILQQYKNINLYHFNWIDNFAAARNFSIEKTTGDYILVLDADEYVINGMRSDLEKIINENYIGRILIDSHFKKDGQVHHSKAYVSRFFPREVRYIGSVHEQLDSDKPRVKINLTFKHDGYYETDKSKRNIPLLLKEVNNNPSDPYYLFQLGKELRINKQFEEAFHFLNRSYDLTNISNAYYGELVIELINSGKECRRNEEVLEIINKNELILKKVSDFHFAKGLFYMDYCIAFPYKVEIYIREIESSFLNCLNSNNNIEYLQGTKSYLPLYNLGVFYEVTGNIKKALDYYRLSSQYGYTLSQKRIQILTEKN